MRVNKLGIIKSIALQFANLSTCSSREKVGAVLYDDSYRIVSTGFNGSPQGFAHCDDVGCVVDSSGSCIMAVHAEVNSLIQCAVYGISTQGLNLFTTVSPCDRCATMIIRAGVKQVTYLKEYHRPGHAAEWFKFARIRYESIEEINKRFKTIERFETHVDKTEGCWNWIGHIFRTGYGSFHMPNTRKNVSAHRVAYMLYTGDIPDNLWVLHTCDNKECVNPEHLFLGTASDNMKDMVSKNRQYNGRGK